MKVLPCLGKFVAMAKYYLLGGKLQGGKVFEEVSANHQRQLFVPRLKPIIDTRKRLIKKLTPSRSCGEKWRHTSAPLGALVFMMCGLSPHALGSNSIAQSFTAVHATSKPHNARACSDCHAVPFYGGSSRAVVKRLMTRGLPYDYLPEASFAVNRLLTERVLGDRVAANISGDAYVEVIPDQELLTIAARQTRQTKGKIHGEVVWVSLPGMNILPKSIGKFGWKSEHASLPSASAEAMTNELGLDNRLFPMPRESSPVKPASSAYSGDSELDEITRFVRSLEPIAPSLEGGRTESARKGAELFTKLGCSTCHVENLKTAPTGAKLNRGTYIVPPRLGDKVFHPYSDFLLHDVGTGDGLTENICPSDYKADTARKFRTAPLWGVRYRSWLMHDGRSVTYHQAIMRHAGEASDAVQQYLKLSPTEKEELRQFLNSL